MNTDPKTTNYHKPSGATGKHRWALILLSLAVVLIVGTVVWKLLLAPNRSGDEAPVFVVRRGPLTISITESGTIKSRDRVVVKSEVEGRTTILWLIDEGTDVQKGDLLVQLDSSSLEDKKVQQQTSRLNAEAAFIRARENLAVIKSQGESDIAKAELAYRFSELDLNKYLKGEYPQELDQAQAQITIAKEELSRAEQKLKWSRTLAEEGYITDTELQADELASKRSELDVELAQGKLRVLQEYSNPRKEEQLRSDIIQAEQALERVRRRATADAIQAEADLKAKEAEFHRKEDILQKTIDQISKCRITAPVSGMAVYSTTGKGSWRGNVEPLAEGQEIRERQELIYLPTTSSMMAEIKIHESSLRKVRTGMRTLISCDALPAKVFTGTVGKIALLPDAQSVWLNPGLKVFTTEIYLDGNGEEIRPGMTCQAQIIVQEYPDTVYVPTQSVMQVAGQATVYLPGPDGPQPRKVELGLDNNRMVSIVSGLKAGERVLLAPPLSPSTLPSQQRPAGKEPSGTSPPSQTARSPQRPDDKKPSGGPNPRRDQRTRAKPPGSDESAQAQPKDAVKLDLQKLSRLSPEERKKWLENLSPEQRQEVTKMGMRWLAERPPHANPSPTEH